MKSCTDLSREIEHAATFWSAPSLCSAANCDLLILKAMTPSEPSVEELMGTLSSRERFSIDLNLGLQAPVATDPLELIEVSGDAASPKPKLDQFDELAQSLFSLYRKNSQASVSDRQLATPEAARFGDVEVDFRRMELRRGGSGIELTTLEFKTLHYLVSHPCEAISKMELLDRVWGYTNYPSTRTVDNRILKLRQKLERNPSKPVHLVTVRGFGYKFVP